VRIVVKLGGSLLTDEDLLDSIIGQVSTIQTQSCEVILVHGGGKQIRYYLEQLRIPSRFHQGLRVTDLATMQVVQMVLAGLVNKEIVASLGRQGCRAAGLCGGDGKSFLARKYQDPDPKNASFDYGYVGEVHRGNPDLVNLLVREGYVPVIACVALGENGSYYNVNADEMAAAVAIFCKAERLIFLTDVPGVFDQQKNIIPVLSRARIEELRHSGVIAEGMLPKTRACERALDCGIQQVHILGGKEPDGLVRVLLRAESLGTAIH
jgi:acetylglutamate kinase